MLRSLTVSILAGLCAMVPDSDRLAASPTEAQMEVPAGLVCAERNHLVSQLKVRFAESQEDVVMRSDTSLMELFVSAKGTWSILHTTSSGTSCLVASGQGLAPTASL